MILSLHARKLPSGAYEGYIRMEDGPYVHREWSSILRNSREDALADAQWLAGQYAHVHHLQGGA